MNATFVLVPGAGHGGWCFEPLADLLRAEGHRVHTPTLTGVGELQHLLTDKVDLEWHIGDIVRLIEAEDLRDVILLGHSYGGMVITGAADRAGDRIAHLVYLDAPAPQEGKSLAGVVGTFLYNTRKHGRTVDGVELVMWPDNHPRTFHGVTDPALQAWMLPRLTPHPWVCLDQPLRLTDPAAVNAVLHTHICCADRIEEQARAAAVGQPNARVWRIDGCHDVMIDNPALVAERLEAIAALHR